MFCNASAGLKGTSQNRTSVSGKTRLSDAEADSCLTDRDAHGAWKETEKSNLFKKYCWQTQALMCSWVIIHSRMGRVLELM